MIPFLLISIQAAPSAPEPADAIVVTASRAPELQGRSPASFTIIENDR